VSLTDDITDPRLAKALAHPLRLEILRHLGDRTASPSEIAAEIGAPLTNVSYHVRKLRTLGLIKLVRKTPKRGVIEHYYSANARHRVTEEAWAGTPDIVKEALAVPSIKTAADEMLRSATAGGFNRSNSHFQRQNSKLDQRGWDDLAKLLLKLDKDIDRIEEEAAARLTGEGKPGPIEAGIVAALFETVGPGRPAEGDSPGGAAGSAAPGSAAPKRRKARA
jgi:DNA-binding transcriptional ArsR family regulator